MDLVDNGYIVGVCSKGRQQREKQQRGNYGEDWSWKNPLLQQKLPIPLRKRMQPGEIFLENAIVKVQRWIAVVINNCMDQGTGLLEQGTVSLQL